MSAKILNRLKLNRKTLIPAGMLALLTLFFVWRAYTLADWFHITAAVIFALLTLLAFSKKLRNSALSNTLNIGISLFFLDLVFAQLNIKAVWDTLITARLWTLLPSLAFLMIHLFIRMWRWQWLLKSLAVIPFWPAFRAGMIGVGGNMVLPAKAGEFLRAYVIGRSQNISKTGAFATVVVERIFDGLTVLLFLIALIVFGVRDPRMKAIGIAGAAFYIIALAVILAFVLQRSWFDALAQRFVPKNILNTVMRLMNAFSSGLDALKEAKHLSVVSVQSIVVWIFVAFSFWPILLAFDWPTPIPLFTSLLLVPMLAFALSIPGAPGGVGAFEWAAALAIYISFDVAGAPLPPAFAETVAACTVLLHISQSVPEAAIGIWAFFAEGLTTSDLQAGREI